MEVGRITQLTNDAPVRVPIARVPILRRPDGSMEFATHYATEPGSTPMQTDPLLQFFAYTHLPAHLQAISKPFGDLAQLLVDTLPRNPERSAGLRKLLESKDAAVRALIFKE